MPKLIKTHKHQRGVYAVEFVLVAGFLFLLLFALMEVGKIMYFFNTANESTRRAARLAAVCNHVNHPVYGAAAKKAIENTVTSRLPFATAANVSIQYCDKADCVCDEADCQLITVSLIDAIYTSSIVPISVKMPAFATTIPRESMDSSFNADCS